MVTKVLRGGLTSVEKSLVEHVGRGEWLDLAGDEAVDEAAMRSWRDSRTIRATVIRDILRGRRAADPDPHGLRLRGAKISGRLDLENLTTDVSLQLKDCLLEEGVLAQNACLASVALTGCRLENFVEAPLYADGLTCRALDLSGTRIRGGSDLGAVRLIGAHISGQLDCTGADLHNKSGPALKADNLQVDQEMFLRSVTATATGDDGAVHLSGAHVGASLHCEKASVRNYSGPALYADRLQVDHDIFLAGGFTATGDSGLGAVRLLGARIGGDLDCSGASVRNDSGPALVADGLQVGQSMILADGFTANGDGRDGAVRVVGARIGGDLECSGRAGATTVRNCSGPALFAADLQVGQQMILDDGFTATGGGEGVAVNLTGARVGGTFRFDSPRLEHKHDSHRLKVDGLTYTGVPERISPEGWRELLWHGTPGYAAQPYQQLAAGYRAQGDDRQARETLMAQRDDQLARTDPGRWERLWGKITKITLGYGYQPWKALLFLAAVVVISCVLAFALGSKGALEQTKNTATPGKPCTVIQKVSVGLDLNLPVGTSLARAKCDLARDSASTTAFGLTIASWFLRLLAWVFAALFIVGFTSAVRKT